MVKVIAAEMIDNEADKGTLEEQIDNEEHELQTEKLAQCKKI
jgi:hypothetical protein